MNKILKNYDGLTPINIGLTIVVLVIGFAGWLVYDRYEYRTTHPLPTGTIAKITNPTTVTYPDKSFQYSYPGSWAQTTQSLPSILGHPINLQSKVVNLVPPNAPMTVGGFPQSVGITVFKSSNTSAVLKNFDGDTIVKNSARVIINGYPALYQQNVTIKSPTHYTIPSSYTDDTYAITHNDVTVTFAFRANEAMIPAIPAIGSSAGMSMEPAFDQTAQLPIFNGIVTSIKFLN